MTKEHKSRSRWWFPLAAVILSTLPFVVLEGVFALFGVGDQGTTIDPLAGFDGARPLFEESAGGKYVTALNHALYFGEQQFESEKDPNDVRIFCLGGSTVRGRPYAVDTSFCKWTELELNSRDPKHSYQIINCGGLSYASYRLTYIAREVLQYKPDVLVVATGHNEFLEDRSFVGVKERADSALTSWFLSLRTVSLVRSLFGKGDVEQQRQLHANKIPSEIDVRLDENSGYASYHWDEQWREQVQNQYIESLQTIADICKESGVPLVLVRLGSNVRDCPPFKSELRADVSDKDAATFDRLMHEAQGQTDNPEAALVIYRQLMEIDSNHALLNYRIARCYDRLGDLESAGMYYLEAKELDVCPLRILRSMDEQLQVFAAEQDIPLVEAGEAIRELTSEGMPGDDFYSDHVHPTIRGHQVIGQELAASIADLKDIDLNGTWSSIDRVHHYQSYLDSLPKAYLSNGRRRVQWLENWARRDRMILDVTPYDIRTRVNAGWKELGFGDLEAAQKQFRDALNQGEGAALEILNFAHHLAASGRLATAKQMLEWLHQEIEHPDMEPPVQLAKMINSKLMGEEAMAILIYDDYFGRSEYSDEYTSQWLKLYPACWTELAAILSE